MTSNLISIIIGSLVLSVLLFTATSKVAGHWSRDRTEEETTFHGLVPGKVSGCCLFERGIRPVAFVCTYVLFEDVWRAVCILWNPVGHSEKADLPTITFRGDCNIKYYIILCVSHISTFF